jgi:bacillithiol biosynthesis deacetylase BshB2
LQPIAPEAVRPALDALCGRTLYLHLETTAGAYTQNGYGAFLRGERITVRRAIVHGGGGAFRCGVETEGGFVYAEGLSHWRATSDMVAFEGYDGDGRLTVSVTLSATPLATRGAERVLPAGERAFANAPTGTPPTPERAVLVVQGHPDDESFSAGGMMALYARAGVPVTQVTLTLGEMGRNLGDPRVTTREELRELRATELRRACDRLGVGDLYLLGVWDKTSEFRDLDVLARRIAAIIRDVKPSLVLTAHPLYGGHPDHCTAGRAAIAAVRLLKPGERPRVHCTTGRRPPQSYDVPVHSVDISDVAEVKIAALREHASQTGAMFRRLESDPSLAADWRQRFGTERYIEYPISDDARADAALT